MGEGWPLESGRDGEKDWPVEEVRLEIPRRLRGVRVEVGRGAGKGRGLMVDGESALK